MLDTRRFPKTDAQLAIVAVDSSLFEVMAKDYRYVQRLKANCPASHRA
jgi:hypothetical protein